MGLTQGGAPRASYNGGAINGMIEACENVAEASGGLGKLLHVHSGVSPEERSILDHFKRRLMDV